MAENTPPDPAAAQSSDAEIGLFVELSSVLTGMPETTLAPSLDPTGLKQIYFAALRAKADPATLDRLLGIFGAIRTTLPPAQWPAAVDQQILRQDRIGPLARQILKLWLLGIFFSPPDQSVTGEVVNSVAFTHGLLWTAIQAHPTGYSELPHGYWSSPPPDVGSQAGGTGS